MYTKITAINGKHLTVQHRCNDLKLSLNYFIKDLFLRSDCWAVEKKVGFGNNPILGINYAWGRKPWMYVTRDYC